ncbi:MAG: hypothetical protein A2X23_07500 [Chloroflexi bacterium GWC2_73_18]|nr:MAG: hypothetical protein A2X23_07500 [Chloroflexi bacterium GWC2_73_18]
MPSGAERSLVVSVHDVASSTLAEVRWLLGRLDALGVTPRVLKVIPREDGRADIRRDPAVGALLRAEAARGSEIVLHGCTHRLAGPPRGDPLLRARARLFAPGVAEFLGLEADEMRARLTAGRAILRELGVETGGFCAPGWLGGPGLRPILAELGFRYDLGMLGIWDVERGRTLRVPSLGYMGAGGAYERAVAVAGGLTLLANSGAPALRLFLHPQGAPDSAACRRSLRVLGRLLRGRRPVTYGELLDG